MANQLFGSILCWLGFHDFHVITESFSFGGGGIETVECLYLAEPGSSITRYLGASSDLSGVGEINVSDCF